MTLLLYLKDEEYGKRLLRFLVQKKNPRLHPELVTAKSKMKYRISTTPADYVVLTDDPGISGDEKHKVIILSNQQDRAENKIFQYQKAEEIYRELLWQLQMETQKPRQSGQKEGGFQKGVYAVFSPDAAGATELAVLLTQYIGRTGTCLYLQMSGLPVYYGGAFDEETDPQRSGVGELLFLLEQENFAERAQQMCQIFGEAHMLPPLTHYKDLLDCRPGDWERFLQRLKEECGYDCIIVEMGQIYEYFLDILDTADHVLFLESPGWIGAIQREVFQRYCRTEHKETLLTHIKYIRQPEDFCPAGKDWDNREPGELAGDSRKMECVRKILEGEVAGDDYIVEYIG